MTELICPMGKLSLGSAIRFCDDEKCAWWDVDDDCCCIRILTRALEDLAHNDRARFEREEMEIEKQREKELEI